MAALAETCQVDPDVFCMYIGEDAASIATDVSEVERWTETTVLAERRGDDGTELVAWLLAETDAEMGRLWWWGPFSSEGLDPIGDRLYDEVRRHLAANIDAPFPEEEACADDRSVSLSRWCIGHGLEPETASVLLRRDPGSVETDPRVRPLADSEADRAPVRALHELAFPGTHTTPDALVRSTHPRLVIEVDDRVVGYVAYELQSDGSGYIDYLAVDPAIRGQGLGGALVDHACKEMFDAGVTYAHLTVRENNPSARALYARCGFVEQRLARPYRLGFKLD